MSLLALDFGGTRIKLGVMDGGSVLAQDTIPYEKGASLSDVMPQVKERFLSLGQYSNISAPEAMVCALPCIVSPDRSRVMRTFGKYDDATEFDLNGWTMEAMGIPCLLENDARAAAIGEWKSGAGQEVENLVMITLGTGIGTAAICEGKPLFGAHGVAGNLSGHTTMKLNGRACICGLRGCAEAHVATWALPGIARDSEHFSESSLSSAEVIDYHTVFVEAKGGDVLAKQLRDDAFDCWAMLVMNLIYQFDPECVVLGGGIMAGKDEILPALHERLDAMMPELHRGVRVSAAELGDAAALVGGWHLWRSDI